MFDWVETEGHLSSTTEVQHLIFPSHICTLPPSKLRPPLGSGQLAIAELTGLKNALGISEIIIWGGRYTVVTALGDADRSSAVLQGNTMFKNITQLYSAAQ
ncbi:hypothetical protein CBL_13007 [Carabus blaptoides fortunei]